MIAKKAILILVLDKEKYVGFIFMYFCLPNRFCFCILRHYLFIRDYKIFGFVRQKYRHKVDSINVCLKLEIGSSVYSNRRVMDFRW